MTKEEFLKLIGNSSTFRIHLIDNGYIEINLFSFEVNYKEWYIDINNPLRFSFSVYYHSIKSIEVLE